MMSPERELKVEPQVNSPVQEQCGGRWTMIMEWSKVERGREEVAVGQWT